MKNYQLKILKLREELADKLKNTDKTIASIILKNGYVALTDVEDIKEVCLEVIEENPDKVKIYKKGKTGIIGALVKAVMDKPNNGASPDIAN